MDKAGAALGAEIGDAVRQQRVDLDRHDRILRRIELLDDADSVDDDIGLRGIDRGRQRAIIEHVDIGQDAVGAAQRDACGRRGGNGGRADRADHRQPVRVEPLHELVPEHAGRAQHQHARGAVGTTKFQAQRRSSCTSASRSASCHPVSPRRRSPRLRKSCCGQGHISFMCRLNSAEIMQGFQSTSRACAAYVEVLGIAANALSCLHSGSQIPRQSGDRAMVSRLHGLPSEPRD